MKKYKFLVALFVLLVFSSCEKDIDVSLPKIPPKLVLISFISPQDSVLLVTVSMTQPLYNNPDYMNPIYITDATVVISSSSGSVTLTYEPLLKRYSAKAAPLKISAGNSYTLSVSTPDGKFAKATTTIPYPNTTITGPVVKDTLQQQALLNPTWKDPEVTKDYYRLEIYYYYTFNQSFMMDTYHINDDENPGGLLKRKFYFTPDTTHQDSVALNLCVLSPEFYTYFDRLDKIFVSTGIDFDPFREPTPMFTNVEGGLGVFAGYNQYKIKIIP